MTPDHKPRPAPRGGPPLPFAGPRANIVGAPPAIAAPDREPDLFRLMVENAEGHAIFLVDAELRVVSWNRGAERLFGYREDEIVRRDVSCFYPSEEAAGGPAGRLAWAGDRGWTEDETWQVRKDGSRFLADAVTTPLRGPDGRLQGFCRVVRVVRVVGGRTRADQAPVRSQEVVGRIAHDLNNVLTPILAASEMLGDDLPADERRALSDVLQSAAGRAADLVRWPIASCEGEGEPVQ